MHYTQILGLMLIISSVVPVFVTMYKDKSFTKLFKEKL